LCSSVLALPISCRSPFLTIDYSPNLDRPSTTSTIQPSPSNPRAIAHFAARIGQIYGSTEALNPLPFHEIGSSPGDRGWLQMLLQQGAEDGDAAIALFTITCLKNRLQFKHYEFILSLSHHV